MSSFNRHFFISLLCSLLKLSAISSAPLKHEKEYTINLNHFPGIYGQPRPEAGKLLKKAHQDGLLKFMNADEVGPYFEGDLLMTHSDEPHGRIIKKEAYLWKNATIPYEIGRDVYNNVKRSIKRAIKAFERRTCLRFIPRRHEREYISFESEQHGCFSNVGRKRGRKTLINLQDECTFRFGNILHEIMHALGFLHEHNRWDRDRYIMINSRNIISSRRHSYNKYPKETTISHNISYDLTSIMHYSATGNAKDVRTEVIIPYDDDYRFAMGQRTHLSSKDVQRIKVVYCPKRILKVNK